MSDLFTWVADRPSSFWTALVVPVVIAGLVLAARRPARKQEGWSVLTPTIPLWLMTLVSFPAALLFAVVSVVVVVLAGQVVLGVEPAQSVDRSVWLMLVGAPLLFVMMASMTAQIALWRIAYNDDGVEIRFLFRRRFHAWADVEIIDRHWAGSPRIKLCSGKSIAVWEYWRGYHDLTSFALSKGVPVEAGL
ncbi:PH domain-containing protein [Caulobacter sp. 17J65-9]|uniref:PH domain-containing protein n=1 Tax=Caulobacter sp. 17J65-9 TaxID=2709382 RepID=UPI0013C81DC9|nr:PH domain-containing protein [Caulobacter sp. 17J65-9]NEX93525.1 hypothetical protein [Caulobacter sp. 17J65-9]